MAISLLKSQPVFFNVYCVLFSDSSSSVPPNIDLNRPGALKVSNPFVVLNEGIAETLGRHMFEKDISPER